jgi:hypothetical protein
MTRMRHTVRLAVAVLALTLAMESAGAEPEPEGRPRITVGDDASCPTPVSAVGFPGVSGDGTRFALNLLSGGLDELLDLQIITVNGEEVLRKVIYAPPDCTERRLPGGYAETVLSPRVPARVAEANALLKKGRYRSIPPLQKDWVHYESPTLTTDGVLRVEIDDKRKGREVLTVKRKGKVIYRKDVPGVAPRPEDEDHCPYHRPFLGGAWRWRRHLLVWIAYASGSLCARNVAPRWLPPIKLSP